ncbi:hypothetical protein BHM03_00013574 [Ensete ventricosum]|nr:hypothetical protein BHM03_00013574 [Ensete ventricosum]
MVNRPPLTEVVMIDPIGLHGQQSLRGHSDLSPPRIKCQEKTLRPLQEDPLNRPNYVKTISEPPQLCLGRNEVSLDVSTPSG